MLLSSSSLILVGSMVSGNTGVYGNDMYVLDSSITTKSSCSANYYNSGSGTMSIWSQNTNSYLSGYTADLMSGSCISCSSAYSCCGATSCVSSVPSCTDVYCPDPTPSPTFLSQYPSILPSPRPSFLPTPFPTNTFAPSTSPTNHPSVKPSTLPSLGPSPLPSFPPTTRPSLSPTFAPTLTYGPSLFTPLPTVSPTLPPSPLPTISCTSGQYYSDAACISCPVGRYSNNTDPHALECSLCPAGNYNIQLGSSTCIACQSGKFSSTDRSYCGDCSAGEYAFNDTSCEPCEFGRYAPSPQQDKCLVCPSGFHTNNRSSATTCTSCSAGYYSAGLTTQCESCPKGDLVFMHSLSISIFSLIF